MTHSRMRPSLFTILLVCMFAAPWLPFSQASYFPVWAFMLTVYLTLASSYDLVGGYLGYMNLGHAAFFGLGAYGTAIIINSGIPVPPAVVGGTALAAVFAAVVSYPLFRLRGAYFALATFGMVGLLNVLATNLSEFTGGSAGISLPAGDRTLPAYYLGIVTVVATVVLNRRIARSKFGLGLRAVRDDEDTALTFGVPVTLYKCAGLVLSSIPAGLIGGLYAWNLAYISPASVFGLEIALGPIVMAMLGGSGTPIGPVLGTLFLYTLQEFLWTQLPYLHLTVYGIIMILTGLFIPGGLARIAAVARIADRAGLGDAPRLYRVSKNRSD